MDSCQAPGRSCQHLNFCFPGKTEHFYWLRTKEFCWEASAVSFNFFFIFLSSFLTFSWLFSAALKLLLEFSQQLQKCSKLQIFFTIVRPWVTKLVLGLTSNNEQLDFRSNLSINLVDLIYDCITRPIDHAQYLWYNVQC